MRFRELAGDPHLISGIHNYCDRWCERCNFTTRCAVYVAEEADSDNDPSGRDLDNAVFWQKLAAVFKETQEMILAWAEKCGVDLSDEALATSGQLLEREQAETRTHPLAKVAEKYAFNVSDWLESEFSRTEVGAMPTQSGATTDTEPDVSNYLEVVQWYQFLIAVKLKRALMSRIDEDDYLAEDDQRDSDGSAKVALIAIDRSIGAWKLIGDLRPQHADAIHQFIFQLEKIRSGAERDFPNARDFIRPGFDEPTLDLLH